jgi:hypothetical protein
MPKLNFDQAVVAKRDVGGLTSKSLLVIANAACLVWALLIIASYRH